MLRNGLEPWHVLIVVAVVVLLFGSRKLPDAARGIGKSLRILKSEVKAMNATESADPSGPVGSGGPLGTVKPVEEVEENDTRTAPGTGEAVPSAEAPRASASAAPGTATQKSATGL